MGLTVRTIEAARPGKGPERMPDGNGLYLRVQKSGRKVFQARVTREGKARWQTLGTYPELSLRDARLQAALARAGQEALEEPVPTDTPAEGPPQMAPAATEELPTFRAFARVWFERKKEGLSNGKHIDQNWSTLRDYVLPELGDRRLNETKQHDLVRVFDPIWRSKHPTASRTLGRVREVYELAKVFEYVETNPADFSHKAAFGPHRKSTRNHASLPYAQMPDCWQWIQEAPCEEMTRQLTMLLVLTAKRTIEGRFARWSDVDLKLGA